MVENVLILGLLLCVAALLSFHPRLQSSSAWKATVTPLASIMGSGFLVCAPLLANNVGYDAVFAMTGLLAVAYAVGGAIRLNILHVESLLEEHDAPRTLVGLETGSRWVLAGAYVISVTYYLQLLAAFVLHQAQVDDPMVAKGLTTGVLLVIAVVGGTWGLSALESVERYAIALNLGTGSRQRRFQFPLLLVKILADRCARQ